VHFNRGFRISLSDSELTLVQAAGGFRVATRPEPEAEDGDDPRSGSEGVVFDCVDEDDSFGAAVRLDCPSLLEGGFRVAVRPSSPDDFVVPLVRSDPRADSPPLELEPLGL
jgi:hypothetical protein